MDSPAKSMKTITRVHDFDKVEDMLLHVILPPELVPSFVKSLKENIKSQELFILRVENKGTLEAFLMAQAPQDVDYVWIAQTWNSGPWSNADAMLDRVLLWAAGIGRSALRAETTRNTEAFFRRFGFGVLSTLVQRELGELRNTILSKVSEVTHGQRSVQETED